VGAALRLCNRLRHGRSHLQAAVLSKGARAARTSAFSTKTVFRLAGVTFRLSAIGTRSRSRASHCPRKTIVDAIADQTDPFQNILISRPRPLDPAHCFDRVISMLMIR
jgi:hypothetical protein